MDLSPQQIFCLCVLLTLLEVVSGPGTAPNSGESAEGSTGQSNVPRVPQRKRRQKRTLEPTVTLGNRMDRDYRPTSGYYAGCWLFDASQPNMSGLEYMLPVSPFMTINKCVDICWHTFNFFYAGLYFNDTEGETRCMCGSNRGQGNEPFVGSSLECYGQNSARCTGNSSQVCGSKLSTRQSTRASISLYKGSEKSFIQVQAVANMVHVVVFPLDNITPLYAVSDPVYKVITVVSEERVEEVTVSGHLSWDEGPGYDMIEKPGFMVTVDKMSFPRSNWKCTPVTNLTWNPAIVYRDWNYPYYQLFNGGNRYWFDKRSALIASHYGCMLDIRCQTTYFGYNCKQRNLRCKDDEIHPISGHCLRGCQYGHGPFCLYDSPVQENRLAYDSPVQENRLAAPCPFCNHCRDGICDVAAEPSAHQAYLGCPAPWTGQCADCEDGFWGNYCDISCSAQCLRCKAPNQCEACKVGFHGMRCDMLCPNPPNCDPDGGCSQFRAKCLKCKPGFFAADCVASCDDHCNHEGCDLSTGHCIRCITGFYGSDCRWRCRGNCLLNKCDYTTGDCIGCLTGFRGRMCTLICECSGGICSQYTEQCERCQTGYYGDLCEKLCPDSCESGCGQRSGICFGCKVGKYGNKCQNQCSAFCIKASCNQTTGFCSYGCTPKGFFGINCEHPCPSGCLNATCDTRTGKCNLGCQVGFYGKQCDDECLYCQGGMCKQVTGECQSTCHTGFYGQICNRRCPGNCYEECEQHSGKCIGCKLGFHGPVCRDSCPENCKNGTCDQTSGVCLNECLLGFYGLLCDKACPTSCKDSYCDRNIGHCVHGCISGLYGSECTQFCPRFCPNRCSQESGYCVDCQQGYYGETCDLSCPQSCQDQCQEAIDETEVERQVSDEVTSVSSTVAGGVVGGVAAISALSAGVYLYKSSLLKAWKSPSNKEEDLVSLEPEDYPEQWKSKTTMMPIAQ